jgi:putative addiction module component (TIGR02574 family)
MTAQADQLVRQALQLTPEERQEIAQALFESVVMEEPVVPEAEAAKAREISRRYHAGKEKAISGDEFRAHLQKWIKELSEEDQRPGVV